jgi:hypothetical protein
MHGQQNIKVVNTVVCVIRERYVLYRKQYHGNWRPFELLLRFKWMNIIFTGHQLLFYYLENTQILRRNVWSLKHVLHADLLLLFVTFFSPVNVELGRRLCSCYTWRACECRLLLCGWWIRTNRTISHYRISWQTVAIMKLRTCRQADKDGDSSNFSNWDCFCLKGQPKCVLLPTIRVRNQIRIKLGGETGKFTFRRIKNI